MCLVMRTRIPTHATLRGGQDRRHHRPPGPGRGRSLAHPYVTAVADPARVRLLADPPPPAHPPVSGGRPRSCSPKARSARRGVRPRARPLGIESYTADELALTVAALERLDKAAGLHGARPRESQLSSQDAHRPVSRAGARRRRADHLDGVRCRRGGRDHRAHSHRGRPPHTAGEAERPVGTAHDHRARRSPSARPPAHIDGVATTATLVRAIADLRAQGARIEGVVRMNERVRDEEAAASIVLLAEGCDGVRIERGPRQDDDELAAWLADLDACLLPIATAPSRAGPSSATTWPCRRRDARGTHGGSASDRLPHFRPRRTALARARRHRRHESRLVGARLAPTRGRSRTPTNRTPPRARTRAPRARRGVPQSPRTGARGMIRDQRPLRCSSWPPRATRFASRTPAVSKRPSGTACAGCAPAVTM